MDGRGLSNKLSYIGMERDARMLALNDKMASAEDIAIMSAIEVCDLIVEKYEVVMSEYESVLLIPKDKMTEFNKMAVFLDR
jgi:hypothetical protein